MTSVSPAALSSLPAQASPSGTGNGPQSGSADTFRSALDREMATRSARRSADSNSGAKPHRTDPHAAHRPAVLRSRGGAKAGAAPAKGAGDAAAVTADTPAEPGTPLQAAVPDAAPVAGSDALAAIVAAQQLVPPPVDLRVALAPGGSAPTESAIDGSAAKGGAPTDAQVPTRSLPTDTQATGADGSVLPTTPVGEPDSSPATSTSIAEALAAGPTTGGNGSTGADASTGQPSTSDQPGASDQPSQPSVADQPGLPLPTPQSSTATDPTRSGPGTASAPVTPTTIAAAAAGEVAEAASDAATATLLSATGAGVPLTTPDAVPTTGDTAGTRTAAALPSHVAELARLARISADGTARLTVRLDPPELGAVTLHLTSRGSAVELSLRAETPAGAAALAAQQGRVRDLLAEHGFDLSHFTITGVGSADEPGFGDPRQRDANGSFPDGNGSADNRFSTDTNSGDRGSSRSTFAGTDGFGSGNRSGSRSDEDWSGDVSPADPSIAATSATEGTWL